MPIENIDTDQIIPARFLKVTDKQGLGDALFSDWRYEGDGTPKPDFVLNKPESRGAQVLFAGDNFGCGSSREHAPWALVGYGFIGFLASWLVRHHPLRIIASAILLGGIAIGGNGLATKPAPGTHAPMISSRPRPACSKTSSGLSPRASMPTSAVCSIISKAPGVPAVQLSTSDPFTHVRWRGGAAAAAAHHEVELRVDRALSRADAQLYQHKRESRTN